MTTSTTPESSAFYVLKGPAPVAAIALTYEAAAAACGCSIDGIRRAVRTGDLVPRYPTSRPVILRADLEEWVESRHAPPGGRSTPGRRD